MPACLAITAEREHSPVLFTQHDQRHYAAASSLSLAASHAEELSGSKTDHAVLPSSASRNTRLRVDEELICVMTKADNELRFEWFPPEKPSCSRLDEWFLPGHHQALRQRSSPSFSEVHDELTKSWRAPCSSCIRPSASVALTSVNGAESKGYKQLPHLDKSVAAHLCPPTAIRWEARACHPSKPCRATSALAGHAYLAAEQAASALHSMAVLQVFQAKMLANEEAGLDSASAGRYPFPKRQLPRPRSSSLYCISRRPLSAGCRGKGVHGSSRAHYSARVSDRCNSGQNKTRIFSKREQKSAYHKHPTLMQPVCTAVSTPSPVCQRG